MITFDLREICTKICIACIPAAALVVLGMLWVPEFATANGMRSLWSLLVISAAARMTHHVLGPRAHVCTAPVEKRCAPADCRPAPQPDPIKATPP